MAPRVMFGGLCLSVVVSVVSNADTPRRLDTPIRVTPLRAIGVVYHEDGTLTPTTDWIELGDGRRIGAPTGVAGPDPADGSDSDLDLFDAFENDGHGMPTDSCCGMGGGRWFFGDTFSNRMVVGDMQAVREDGALHVQFAWSWYVTGPGSSEQCFVAVMTGDFFDDTCGDPPYRLLDGIVYDFGVLESSSDVGYYISDIDLTDTGLFHTVYTDGAFGLIYARDYDGERLTCATSAQPMLWGNKSLDGCKDLAGGHGPIQYGEGDNPDCPDSTLGCDNFASGLCPDPLTAMIGFGDGIGMNCTGGERIRKARGKTKCKNDVVKKTSIIVKLAGGNAGEAYTVTLDNGLTRSGTLNDHGKASAKFKSKACQDIPPGTYTASASWACGATDDASVNVSDDCPCP